MEQQTNQNKKAKFRLPFSAVLLYLALIAAALSGVTFSRYVTGTTVGDSARVAMMKELTVTETEGLEQRVILPGVDMTKKAVVDFEGSEMACYVFCAITANGWTRAADNFHYTAGTDILSWAVDKTKWIFLQGDGSTSVYTASLMPILRCTLMCWQTAAGSLSARISPDHSLTHLQRRQRRCPSRSAPQRCSITASRRDFWQDIRKLTVLWPHGTP